MATIKISELPTTSINSSDFLVKADSNGLATKNTVQNLLAPLDLKVNISSIVDNVTAGGSDVPLSAEQGKVLKAEILALAGSLIPQGNWDADTNTPDISGTTETGYYWIVSVSGSTDLGGETDWKENDWAIKTASGWAKIDNTDKVLSVAGRIGAIVLGISDITSLQSGLNLKANLSGGNTFEGSQIFNNSTIGSLNKIIINNSINDSGLEVNNTDDDGFGLNINNTSTGIGSRIVNEVGGIGSFFVNNQDSFTEGNAIEILNKGAGNSIFINNDTSGNGFVSSASDSETTGFNFVGQNETVNTFTVDKEGNVVGLSFIGDGSALTNMPVSTAQQTALDLKANKASPNFTGNATFGGSVNLESLKNTSIISLKSTTSDSSWSVGDRIGAIDFYSADGSGAGSGKKASISYEVEEGNTGSSLAMVFRGAGVGSGENNLERLRIDSNGDFDFKSGDATFGGDVEINPNKLIKSSTSFPNTIQTFQSAKGQMVFNTHFGDANGGYLFKTNGSERLKITGVGKVKASGEFEAVGNATFGGELTIEGNFEFNKSLIFKNTKGTGLVSYYRSHGANGEFFSFYHNDVSRDFIGSDGSRSFYNNSEIVYTQESNGNHDFKSGNATFGGDINVSTGNVLFDFSSTTNFFEIKDDGDSFFKVNPSTLSLTVDHYNVSELNGSPSSATDTGVTGEVRYTADYIYLCTATDTWKRTPLTTW